MPSQTELLHEAEWRKCATDPVHFFQKYWKVRHPTHGAVLFQLRPAQVEVLDAWLNEKQTISLKARQIGWTTLSSALSFWLTFFHDDRFVLNLSRKEDEANKVLAKSKYGYKRLPEWMQQRGPRQTVDTQSKVEWDNGSAMESQPASNPGRGETAYMIFTDEFAHFEDGASAWAAIEPAADVGGRIHILSTANGVGNMFHQMWVSATTGSNRTMRAIFFPWSANTDRDMVWYEQKRRDLPAWQLAQEYPTTAEEAFIKSGNPVFDLDVLLGYETSIPRHGRLRPTDPNVAASRSFTFVDETNGPLACWELPRPGCTYVIGADVAEGLEHGDYSVAHVINAQTGVVAAKWRGHADIDTFGSTILRELGLFYNFALVGPEANSFGLAVCFALRNSGYGRIYKRHSYDRQQDRRSEVLGWYTSARTKPLMITELAKALREHDLKLMDAETIGELKTYVREADGKMHGSPYDDQTMSLAIANQMLRHAFSPEYAAEAGPMFGSWEWLEEDLWGDELSSKANSWQLGKHSVR